MTDQPQQPQPNDEPPPVPEQPVPGQNYPGQNYPGQPYPGQNYPGQPPYPQDAYGTSAYGNPGPYAAPQFQAPTYHYGGPGYVDSTSGPRGISLSSMIIGLASLLVGFGFFIIPQIVGIVLGHIGLIKESPQGKAFAITGLITNYLALVIYGGIYVVIFVFLGSAASSPNWDSEYSSSALLLGL